MTDIIVCGHYGCGGVTAAMSQDSHGTLDAWLCHIKDVHSRHRDSLERIRDPERKRSRLCELNIIEQVRNVCAATVVQPAWQQGQALAVHGWVYDLKDGLLRDLGICATGPEEIDEVYRLAIATDGDRGSLRSPNIPPARRSARS